MLQSSDLLVITDDRCILRFVAFTWWARSTFIWQVNIIFIFFLDGVVIAGTKTLILTCRLFKYPNFDNQQVVANKSFFQADKVEYYWNAKGNNALLLTVTEVDKTGGSYYGKQGLHFIGTNGYTSLVTMSKYFLNFQVYILCIYVCNILSSCRH